MTYDIDMNYIPKAIVMVEIDSGSFIQHDYDLEGIEY